MRVLVLGAGITGAAVVRHLARASAEVVLADDDAAAATELARQVRRDTPGLRITAVEADPAALDGVDLVVPSPGARPSHPVLATADRRGVSIRSEIDLAAELAPPRFAAVTGTNGKTTVTTSIVEMLQASGIAAVAAGNIGTPLIEAVEEPEPVDVIVAEVSSFQLHYTTRAFAPGVAVLLNVAADHLDWHAGLDGYRRDKARIFAHQGRDDLLIANVGDATVAELVARARAVGARGFRVRGSEVELTGTDPPELSAAIVDACRGAGFGHAVENALAASLAARALGAGEAGILAALRAQPRLHHRVELVGQAGGVQFFDDSKATNPHATRAAVDGLAANGLSDALVVLIAGGRNKGLDLGALRPLAPRLRAVVAIGEAADDVEAVFAGHGVTVRRASSMRAAVLSAADLARPGDAVLLSPACASFDWYESYEARGRDFAREVATLVGAG